MEQTRSGFQDDLGQIVFRVPLEEEEMVQEEYEQALIEAYVPEAEYMSYDDALALAEERDAEAARQLKLQFEGE